MKTNRRSVSGGVELKKASRLFRLRKFNDVIRILEPQTFRYRENVQFYYLLGTSCLHIGDYGGAYTYLKRAYQLDAEDIDVLLGLAAVHLRRKEHNEAIMDLLTILDIDPGNKKAKRGLKTIREAVSKQTLDDFIQSEKIKTLFPSVGFAMPRFVFVLAAVFLLVPLFFFFLDDYEILSFLQQQRRSAEIEQITIAREETLTATEGEYRYVLTKKEIMNTFSSAKEYFNRYRDNLAQREINRLLYSNASEMVKEKARLLMDHLKAPTFTSLKTSFSYNEVMEDPHLYRNCYVIWKGRVSNINIGTDVITFDFLVGYHEEKVLQGIIPVKLHFGADIEPTFPLEILGQIKVDDRMWLKGISIHKLAPE